MPYNAGRYITLDNEPTTNQEVPQFRADLRNLTNDALAVDDDHYSEQRFLDVQRIIERFHGREARRIGQDLDSAGHRRAQLVRLHRLRALASRPTRSARPTPTPTASPAARRRSSPTRSSRPRLPTSSGSTGGRQSRDFRFAVIDEAFGRGSDDSTRFALQLFATLGLQLLVVTPLQKVHVIEPYVQAIGFVDNPTGRSLGCTP